MFAVYLGGPGYFWLGVPTLVLSALGLVALRVAGVPRSPRLRGLEVVFLLKLGLLVLLGSILTTIVAAHFMRRRRDQRNARTE